MNKWSSWNATWAVSTTTSNSNEKRSRSEDCVFGPETLYERQGDVNSVMFPCGWILDKASGAIRLYYGGADTCLALATVQLADVLGYLRKSPSPPPRKRAGMTFLNEG